MTAERKVVYEWMFTLECLLPFLVLSLTPRMNIFSLIFSDIGRRILFPLLLANYLGYKPLLYSSELFFLSLIAYSTERSGGQSSC